MSDTNKQKQDKLKIVLTDLNSGDSSKIAKAIPLLETTGDATVIIPLMDLWVGGVNATIEKSIIALLEGLKDTSTVEPLIFAFRNVKYAKLKRNLVSVFWNSKLDFSSYLADFVLFAIEGDFLDVLEVVTLVEQFETMVPESAVMESQLLLKEYFNGNENREEQKDQLLSVVVAFVQQFDQESDLDELDADFFDEEETD